MNNGVDKSVSNLMLNMFITEVAVGALYVQILHLKFTATSAVRVTPRDVIKLIRSLRVYTKTENWRSKKKLIVKRTQYI
jgi:hypothetical protein